MRKLQLQTSRGEKATTNQLGHCDVGANAAMLIQQSHASCEESLSHKAQQQRETGETGLLVDMVKVAGEKVAGGGEKVAGEKVAGEIFVRVSNFKFEPHIHAYIGAIYRCI